MYNIRCPHCNGSLRVAEEYAGHRGRCTHCRKTLIVPQPPKDPMAVAPAQRADDFQAWPSAQAPPPPPAAETMKELWSSRADYGTTIKMVVAGQIAVAATLLLYVAVLLPTRGLYLSDLVLESRAIGVAIALLTTWSIGALVLKHRQIKRQVAAFAVDILPIDVSLSVTTQNADEFLDHIDRNDDAVKKTFLINRVRHALAHFKSRGKPQEVYNYVNSQSEIDSGIVASSYSMIKVFIWAIPILGFIGTVHGIGQSVSEFHSGLGDAQNLEAVRGSLKTVVSGLTVAFNTTLLGLLASLLVMFPATALQRTEDRVLQSVEAYCNEKVLRRLHEDDAAADESSAGARGVGDRAAERMERAAQTFADSLRERGEQLANGLIEVGERHADQMAGAQREIADKFKGVVDRLDQVQREMRDSLSGVAADMPKEAEALGGHFKEACADLSRTFENAHGKMAADVGKLQETYAEATANVSKMTASATQQIESIQECLRTYAGHLQTVAEGQSELLGLLQDGRDGAQVLTQLNGTLERLADQMDAAAQAAQTKRPWFGWFRAS